MGSRAAPRPGATARADADGAADATGWDAHVHVFDAAAPVREGHYRPVDRPLAQIESTAAAHGVGHLVLVQPSVYGTDNTVMLRALAARPGRHRGVAVVDDALTDGELDAMHAVGVRGVRLNLVSPVGERTPPEERFIALAPRLRARGWHLQWYARAHDVARIAAIHAGSGVVCVLDHLGGFGAHVAPDDPAWKALQHLASQGAWIKLSGWYRLDSTPPHADLAAHVQRVAPWFGTRMIWGSDWPHTAFAPDAMPAYASTWEPVVAALGAQAADVLRRRPPALYA